MKSGIVLCHNINKLILTYYLPSVLWHCWLGGRKGIFQLWFVMLTEDAGGLSRDSAHCVPSSSSSSPLSSDSSLRSSTSLGTGSHQALMPSLFSHVPPTVNFVLDGQKRELHCVLQRESKKKQDAKLLPMKKVAHTRLPSIGFWSWSRFLAVSLQVMWVINLAVGNRYFSPGPQLPRNY